MGLNTQNFNRIRFVPVKFFKQSLKKYVQTLLAM
jgi:hypothetical protein